MYLLDKGGMNKNLFSFLHPLLTFRKGKGKRADLKVKG